MIKGFEFVDAGRSYACTVEEQKGSGLESWWWFSVSGDNQRYSPFRAAKDDTRTSVQQRVVEFYANRLFRMSQPTVRGSHWGKRNLPAMGPEQAKAPEASA